MISYLTHSYPVHDYRYASSRERYDDAASMMLTIQSMKPEKLPIYLDIVARAAPGWDMAGFVRTAIDTSQTMEIRARRMETYIHEDTKNGHILALTGIFLKKANRFQDAARYLEKSIELEPSRNLATYGVLAGIYLKSFNSLDRAIACVERGLSECRLSPDAPKYKRALQEMKEYRASIKAH